MNLKQQIDATRNSSMVGLDVPWLLGQWAERNPDKTALIWEPFEGVAGAWSYRELRDDARRVAAGLHRQGVRTGDFVILHLDNSPEFVISWYVRRARRGSSVHQHPFGGT